ncbi:MAG: M23 family metallopeptidase [Firmicutes bacterium]|nr:M23 family metallopeptidase [Bacillota bacterium]
MSLYMDDELVTAWNGSGKDRLELAGQAQTVGGATYRLECSGTVGRKPFTASPVEKQCPDLGYPFRDPASYDWAKIKLAAQYLVEMDTKDRLIVLDKMGVQLPEAYQKDDVLRDSSIDVILTSAAEGHWGAYDYIAMVQLQDRILTALENTSFIGEGFDFPDGSYEITPSFTANTFPQFRYPLDSFTITAGFAPYSWDTNGQSLHTGLDLAAKKGTEIHAAADGIVTTAEFDYEKGYGYYIVIDHGNGLETLYAHCSELLVEAGQTVSQGDLIARVGSTGTATGPHCHFEIRVNGEPVDPTLVLGPGLPLIEGLGFEKSGDFWLHATGIDAQVVEYSIPTKTSSWEIEGSLYFADPRFLGSYFDKKTIEGNASWGLGSSSVSPYATIDFCWRENSPENDGGAIYGPGIECVVDVIDRKLIEKTIDDPYGDADITLTDDELIEIGCKLASILYSAQAYDTMFNGER